MTNKFINQDYQQSRLKSLLRKFYDRYNDPVSKCNLLLGRMPTDVYHTYCSAIIIDLIVYGFFRFSRLQQRAYGGCTRSAEDAHSSLAHDPTSKVL